MAWEITHPPGCDDSRGQNSSPGTRVISQEHAHTLACHLISAVLRRSCQDEFSPVQVFPCPSLQFPSGSMSTSSIVMSTSLPLS